MQPSSQTPIWRFLIDENLPATLTLRLHAEGYEAEHAFDVGLRNHPDSDVFAYALQAKATLLTQDHDLERDTAQFPKPHAGIVVVELPQDWPREHKIQRIVAALRGLSGQSLNDSLVVIESSQVLVRR